MTEILTFLALSPAQRHAIKSAIESIAHPVAREAAARNVAIAWSKGRQWLAGRATNLSPVDVAAWLVLLAQMTTDAVASDARVARGEGLAAELAPGQAEAREAFLAGAIDVMRILCEELDAKGKKHELAMFAKKAALEGLVLASPPILHITDDRGSRSVEAEPIDP